MKDLLLKLYVKAQIFREDNGQDLIEYALTAALIAVACVASMSTLAASISKGFTNIGTKLTALGT
jgi:pilus assembly protein Flp/PilA